MTRAQLSIIEHELQQLEDLERLAIVTDLPNAPPRHPAFADYARTPMPLDPDLPVPANDVMPDVDIDIDVPPDLECDVPADLDVVVDIDVPVDVDVPADIPRR